MRSQSLSRALGTLLAARRCAGSAASSARAATAALATCAAPPSAWDRARSGAPGPWRAPSPLPGAAAGAQLRSARALRSSAAAAEGRVVSFPLAQTGEGISECELVSWHVKVTRGAAVAADEHAAPPALSSCQRVWQTVSRPHSTPTNQHYPTCSAQPGGGCCRAETSTPLLSEMAQPPPNKRPSPTPTPIPAPTPHPTPQEGDVIEAYQPVCEVQSDKASIEITSRYSGVVRALHHAKGDMVKVGQTRSNAVKSLEAVDRPGLALVCDWVLGGQWFPC